MNKDYSDAYHEVLEVIKNIPKNDYDKIPKKLINLLEQNRNEKNSFVYNVALPFDKQEISKDAKVILAVIYRKCWATDEEKKNIYQEEKLRIQNEEKEKREKYNPDNIFKNEKQIEKELIEELQKNNYLIVQEKWYMKIFYKIKKIFKK